MVKLVHISFLIFGLSILSLGAQSLSIFDVDSSNSPLIKAKFFAFDAYEQQQKPGVAELSLKEEGTLRQILSVSCPPVKPPILLSSVLTIDVTN